MTQILIIAGAVMAVIIAIRVIGWAPTATIVCFVGLAVFPRDIGSFSLGGVQLNLSNLVVLAVGLVALLSLRKGTFPVRYLLLIAVVLLALNFVWQGTSNQWVGLTTFAIVITAWFAGTYLASINRGDPRIELWIAAGIFAIIGFEAAVSILQTAGFNIFPTYDRTSELTSGRANGTLGHPGSLGKALIFLALIVFPLTRSTEKLTRRFAIWSIILLVVPIGLSASRANFAAALVLVVLWALLLPRQKKLGARVALPLGALIVALLFFETIVARFAEDPEGGARDQLMQVALAHIGENFLWGVGPNSYISYFGQFDQLTSQGWRVHNVFMLQLAEIGLIGALFLFVPLFAPYFRALGKRKLTDSRGDYARILLTSLPVVIIMGTTGWGLASGAMFYLWFFTIGYVVKRMMLTDDELWKPEAVVEAPTNSRRGVYTPRSKVAAGRGYRPPVRAGR